MFRKILIANRGEIACRIARTCRRMGIAVAGVHSSADRDALHTRLIGQSTEIGGPAARDSYLRIDAVIEAARRSGAQAIHPGYGFLAENAGFARAVEAAGLVFVGPTPEVIELLGDKASAKAQAHAAGVAILDGSDRPSADVEEVAAMATRLGLPVMLKPTAGGGGKGMHVVRQQGALRAAIETAMREAASAFGHPALIVEHYVERGRHVEVQIAGDGRGQVIHLFERECTLQRRHQKLIEEAPAARLSAVLREALLADAVRLGERLAYRGVGTVEFIVSGDRHWFLEVNPRLQVEHPVTEEVTGIDIVELMLRVAAGEGLPLRQAQVSLRGHAVEVRLCAEDPAQGFMPSTGEIVDLHLAHEGVRVERGVCAGSVVTPDYDSMLAKLIVHAPSRDAALDRLALALADTRVLGVTTNCALLRQLIDLPATRDASFNAGSVDEALAGPQAPAGISTELLAAVAAWWLQDSRAQAADYGAWTAPDITGWQLGAGDDPLTAVPALLLRACGRTHEVRLGARGSGGDITVQVGDERLRLALRPLPHSDDWQVVAGDRLETMSVVRGGDALHVQAAGDVFVIEAISYLNRATAALATSGELRTPMMGTILKTHAGEGEQVRAGDTVVTMESMKMELKICAEQDGGVRSILVAAGQTVERGLVVAVIDAPRAAP
jgi:3-methylcrotonyl-CoA carboxylase alpha subunit